MVRPSPSRYITLDTVDGDGRLQACALIVTSYPRYFEYGVREEYSTQRYAIWRDGTRVDHLDGDCSSALGIDRTTELAVPGGAVRLRAPEVVRVDAGGAVLWHTSVGDGVWDVLIDGDDLYVTAGNQVFRLALADGAVAWTLPVQP